LKKASSASSPSLHHHGGLTVNFVVEIPALRRSTGEHGLLRKRRGPLFREEQLFHIHSGDGSCHQSQTERKRIAALLQIWP
jgi:hypothetical protein